MAQLSIAITAGEPVAAIRARTASAGSAPTASRAPVAIFPSASTRSYTALSSRTNAASSSGVAAGTAPEAASAADSPELWPIITSGSTPSERSSDCIAMPATNTASLPTSMSCMRASRRLRLASSFSLA